MRRRCGAFVLLHQGELAPCRHQETQQRDGDEKPGAQLARFQGSDFWFPGVVQKAGGDTVIVAYDDGDRETLSARHVKPHDWRIGSRVECKWNGGAEWFGGRTTEMGKDGSSINIAYDDGDRERTKTSSCRSR